MEKQWLMLLFNISVRMKLFLLLVILLAMHYMPLDVLESMPSVCVWHNVFGIEQCFGCGMTRAFLCLLHGDIKTAVAYNKGVIIVAPLLFYVFIKDIGKRHL